MSESTKKFRAGDEVLHVPSGEEWVLAVDEEDGRVMPAGWPESRANASDLKILRAATEKQRVDMLTRTAHSRGARASAARRQLGVEGGQP